VAGVLAAAQEMHVRVDEPRDHRRALEVQRPAAGTELGRMADARDAAVTDGERRRDAVAAVHRQEAAIDEIHIGRLAARGVAAVAFVVVVAGAQREGSARGSGCGALDESAAGEPGQSRRHG
jgi:hypothetical protein